VSPGLDYEKKGGIIADWGEKSTGVFQNTHEEGRTSLVKEVNTIHQKKEEEKGVLN